MTFRVLHRYLGYFLAGIMMVYALSGITLIFRKTDALKIEQLVEEKIEPNVKNEALGKMLRKKDSRLHLHINKQFLTLMLFFN